MPKVDSNKSIVEMRVNYDKGQGAFNMHSVETANGNMSLQAASSTAHSEMPAAPLDSRSATVTQESVKSLKNVINAQKTHPIGWGNFVAGKIKAGDISITDKKSLKTNAPGLKNMLVGYRGLLEKNRSMIDGKRPYQGWIQHEYDETINGQTCPVYTIMMQIGGAVSDNAINGKIEDYHKEAENLKKQDPTHYEYDGKTLIVKDDNGKAIAKIKLPVKGYPENYISFNVSNEKDKDGKTSDVSLLVPITPESKEKLQALVDKTKKDLDTLKKITYTNDSDEGKAIKELENYYNQLDKTNQQVQAARKGEDDIKLQQTSLTAAHSAIISNLLNGVEKLGGVEGNPRSVTELFDAKFTQYTQNANKIEKSTFTIAAKTITFEINKKVITGNTCVLYHNGTSCELYTHDEKGDWTKCANPATKTATAKEIRMFLGKGDAEILLAKNGDTSLYTMGKGKELDLMLTGKTADGFTANIGDAGVDKLQGSAGQKAADAIKETYSNLVKSGTPISDLQKAKLEAAATMMARSGEYNNFANDQDKTNFIKDVIEPRYKSDLLEIRQATHIRKGHLTDKDYKELETFAGTFADTTLTAELLKIEKGEAGTITIDNIFGDQKNKPLTINFAASKQILAAKAALAATEIGGKKLNVATTLDALIKATQAGTFTLANTKQNDTNTTFDQLSAPAQITVLKEAQAKANLLKDVVELNNAKNKDAKEYIPLLNTLANNQQLKNVTVTLNNNQLNVPALLAAAHTCLSAANGKDGAFDGTCDFKKEPFVAQQQAQQQETKEQKALKMLTAANITITNAKDLLTALQTAMKVEALDKSQKIEKDCNKFTANIAKAICNAQFVGLQLQ